MKLLARLVSVLSPLSFLLAVWRRGEFVGEDQAGNRYFRAPPRKGYRREQRWVLYKGAPEASAIPPEWHGWMHHQTDAVPSAEGPSFRKIWQQPYAPNMTGTSQACLPPGHQLAQGVRPPATGDYEAWRPQ